MIDEQFESTLDEHGVTRRQWQLLNVLSREGATAKQLDDAVAPFLAASLVTGDADSMNVSPESDGTGPVGPAESSQDHLVELIESAWVVARVDTFELTDRGRTAFGKLAEVVGAQRSLMAEGVSGEEYTQTVSVLERMARNLGWSDE